MTKIDFSADTELMKELIKWWSGLEDNRGQRAELRRAKGVKDVIMLPCFHRACRQFGKFFKEQYCWQERLAFTLGVLAHVKQTRSDKKLAAQMAEGNDKPVVSELRFRRLLQCEREELYVALIRVIRLLDGNANIYDLAHSCFYWGDKYRGDETKKDWAFAYFSNIKS